MRTRVMLPLTPGIWNCIRLCFGKSAAEISEERFTNYCRIVIENGRKAYNNANNTNTKPLLPTTTNNENKDEDDHDYNRHTLLYNLLRTSTEGETSLNDEEILANVKGFFIAGSDTTSNVITWTIYFWCLHPEIFQAVRDEVDKCKARNGVDFVKAVANNELPLVSACFRESNRLHPVVPNNGVSVTNIDETMTLSNGVVLDAKSRIIFLTVAIQQDPDVYDDPLTYNPYRWLHATDEKRELMMKSFLAFGYGPRVCPGQHLAELEGVAVCAALAGSFDFTLGKK